MSHIINVKLKDVSGNDVEFDNLEAMKLAAARLGGTFVEGQTTYKCYASGWVGDTKPPEHWDPSMWGKCEHAITFPDCQYEIGIVKLKNGKLTPMFDYWGTGGLKAKLGGQDAPKLVDAYAKSLAQVQAAARIENLAKARNHGIVKTVTPQGTIKLQIRVP